MNMKAYRIASTRATQRATLPSGDIDRDYYASIFPREYERALMEAEAEPQPACNFILVTPKKDIVQKWEAHKDTMRMGIEHCAINRRVADDNGNYEIMYYDGNGRRHYTKRPSGYNCVLDGVTYNVSHATLAYLQQIAGARLFQQRGQLHEVWLGAYLFRWNVDTIDEAQKYIESFDAAAHCDMIERVKAGAMR